MSSLRDYIFYGFPPAFVAFFVFAAAVLLTPILLGHALVLYRAARGAGYMRWRLWLSLVPLLAGLGNLVLAGISWTLFLRLRFFFSFDVAICCSEHPYRDWPADSATKQALATYEVVAVPSVVWLIIAYALALASLVALALLRRQAEAAVDTES